MIQDELETAIHTLVREFCQKAYAFFTEADAVARFYQLLVEHPVLGRKVPTKDGHEVCIAHREYPTFFRFSAQDPLDVTLAEKASRGHYDTVLLRSAFVSTHAAEAVANRRLDPQAPAPVQPFEAVIEFKLYPNTWNKTRARGVITTLGKLSRSAAESPLRYLIVLQRHRSPYLNRWNQWWPEICETVQAHQDVGSIFAIQWLSDKEGSEVHCFGRWRHGYSGQEQDK